MKLQGYEMKFADKVIMRGLIYVFGDFTYLHVEVFCFLPAFVSMDCSDIFQYNPQLLKSKDHSVLQQIFHNRENVIRIVYTMSSSHASLHQLASDLWEYGVLRNGFTKTPSDTIEVICFIEVSCEHIRKLCAS